MTYISKTFEILKATGRPMTYMELVKDIPGSSGNTVARALRKLFEKGCVTRKAQDPAKLNGTKLWTAIPTALYPIPRGAKAPVQPVAPAGTATPSNPGKAFSMCLPINKPTLVTATIQAIEELVDAKEKFSAHDVTNRLRNMVKDGKANVDHTESGTVYAYGKTLPRIDHDDVKGIVHEYFQSGKMDGYTRIMDGDHWLYSEMVALVPTPPPVVLLVPADYNGDPTL